MTKTLEPSGQRKALGRGLNALLPPQRSAAAAEPPPEAAAGGGQQVVQIPISKIEPNPWQPRRVFDEERLNELAQSIRADGVIQPIVVRRAGSRYTLVVGERRWRAAEIAGLKEIPALVQDIPENRLLEITLVENIQREDLNPMEVAHAMDQMSRDLHLSHEEIAARTGKDRATVTNLLRLLKLPSEVQHMVATRQLSMGHARAILSLADEMRQVDAAKKAVNWNLSVRRLELMVRRMQDSGPLVVRLEKNMMDDPNIQSAIAEMERVLGTRVQLVPKNDERGRLEIEYYSEEDLNRIYEVIVKP